MSGSNVPATQAPRTLAPTYDYGADAGVGFENQTNEDVQIPFLGVLQDLSPLVKDRSTGALPGELFNTVTGERFSAKDGVIFQPVDTKHVYVEWKPRNQGGGFVAIHELDSKVVTDARNNQKFGEYKTPAGNELNETFYVTGLLHRSADVAEQANNAPEPMVIAFASTKIKAYKGIMTRIRTFMNGKAPLFAHRLRITTKPEKNNEGEFHNIAIAPLVDNGYAGTGKTTLAKEFADGLDGRCSTPPSPGRPPTSSRRRGARGRPPSTSSSTSRREEQGRAQDASSRKLEDIEKTLQARGHCDEEQIKPRTRRKRFTRSSSTRRPSTSACGSCSTRTRSSRTPPCSSSTSARWSTSGSAKTWNRSTSRSWSWETRPSCRRSWAPATSRPQARHLLTEVHRQAKDNPILRLATDVREGRGLRLGEYGDSRVIKASRWTTATRSWRSTRCWSARTSAARDQRPDARAPGPGEPMPEPRRPAGLPAQQPRARPAERRLWDVTDKRSLRRDAVDLDLKSDDGISRSPRPPTAAYFLGKEPPFWDIKESDCFDYGYALTVPQGPGQPVGQGVHLRREPVLPQRNARGSTRPHPRRKTG
jgi:hypothetical protein